jgi:lysophospholipase
MSVIKVLSEENYAENMKNIVEPYLEKYRYSDYFSSYRGGKLFYNTFLRDDAKGTVIILHGFTESSEKFFEMTYYFLKAGYNVFSLDHRGHGKSLREGDDPETVYLRSFDDYVKDFRRFFALIVEPQSVGLPCYLYAHSMGGAIAVRYLQDYRCEGIDKCVLTAPMISAKTHGLPHSVTTVLTSVLTCVGQGMKRVPTGKGFNANRTWEESNATSKDRFDYWQAKRVVDRDYQASDPSNKWTLEAMKLIPKIMSRRNCSRIDIPVLLCQAEEDGSVENPKHNEFVKKLPDGRLVWFRDSRHEIYLSGSEVLQKYLDTIFEFIEG